MSLLTLGAGGAVEDELSSPFVASSSVADNRPDDESSETWTQDFEVGLGVVFVKNPTNSGRTVTGVTVNGVAATLRAVENTSHNISAWTTPIASAGDYDVVVTYSSFFTNNKGIITGTLVGVTNAVPVFTSKFAWLYYNRTSNFPDTLTRPANSVTLMYIATDNLTVESRKLSAVPAATAYSQEISPIEMMAQPD